MCVSHFSTAVILIVFRFVKQSACFVRHTWRNVSCEVRSLIWSVHYFFGFYHNSYTSKAMLVNIISTTLRYNQCSITTVTNLKLSSCYCLRLQLPEITVYQSIGRNVPETWIFVSTNGCIHRHAWRKINHRFCNFSFKTHQ